MQFIEKIYQNFTNLTQCNHVYIAYSGGLDSHVLLHVFYQLRDKYPQLNLQLQAIHINHNIAPEADLWQKHCQKICEDLNIPCLVHKVNALEQRKIGDSLEAVARQLRYQAFSELVPPHTNLLTAHHADDQAETLLLQMLRGSGPKGLSSIADNSDFGLTRRLLRPLLIFSRSEVNFYAKEHNLQWINDLSNNNTDFDRNFLRKEVIPLLKQRWRGFLQTSHRVTINCNETQRLAELLAVQDYNFTLATTQPYHTLDIEKIRQLEDIRQKNLLRYFIQLNNLSLPSRQKLTHIQSDVLNCRYDAQPLIKWHNAEIRRYKNLLFALKSQPYFDASKANALNLTWQINGQNLQNLDQSLQLPYDLGILHIKHLLPQHNIHHINHHTNHNENHNAKILHIRWRQGNEKIRPHNKQHHYSLNRIFQMHDVPPWERNKIPLIYDENGNLLMIVGYVKSLQWHEKFPFTDIYWQNTLATT